MSITRQTVDIIDKRIAALKRQQANDRANNELHPQMKASHESYYSGALNELHRVKALIEAA